jgi:hypothetical protein
MGVGRDFDYFGPMSSGPMQENGNWENADMVLDSDEEKARASQGQMATQNEGHRGYETHGEAPTGQERTRTQRPWWCDLLASPVKRLRLNDWSSMWTSPPSELTLPERDGSCGESETETAGMAKVLVNDVKPKEQVIAQRRSDLPVRAGDKRRGKHIPKPTLKRAIELVKSKQRRDGMVARIEGDYYSNSWRAAKESRRRSIMKILEAAEASYPLSPESLRMLAGSLKEAGYKSAYNVHHRSEDPSRRVGARLVSPFGPTLQVDNECSKTRNGTAKESPKSSRRDVVQRVSTT